MAQIFASSNLNPPPLPPPPSPLMGSTLPTPRSTPAWFGTSCCHFDGCFRFFVVFAIGLLRRFLYPMLDPLAFVPFPKPFSIWPFPKPWFTHMFWFKLKPWFEQNQCFCFQTIFYTKSCFTQKLCYPQTQCFTQKQCSWWACAMALCSLQDSSFHGGRRNTPKAVKFAACWHVHAWNMKLCLSKVYEPKKLYFSDFCVLNVHLLRLAKRGKHA